MIVQVNIAGREDGGIRVWSDELPGLILSGSTPIKVLTAIVPACRVLLERKGVKPDSLRIDATFINSPGKT